MQKSKGGYTPDAHEKKVMSFFKKVTAIPYLLVFLALLMPLMNVSCTGVNVDQSKMAAVTSATGDSSAAAPAAIEVKETVLLEANIYQLASGVNLDEQMSEEGLVHLRKMENSPAINTMKSRLPEYPKLPSMQFLWVILLGALLAAAFALVTPLGSITLGMLTMVAMWGALAKMGEVVSSLGIPMLKAEPGIGLYAATFMIFFGTAMNFVSIIRPIVMELKYRRQAKKSESR